MHVPRRATRKTLTAHFPRTVSVYEGSDVRVLGVPVGTVDTVDALRHRREVTMRTTTRCKLPADAKAVIIAPSIVGDRYVQLTPGLLGRAARCSPTAPTLTDEQTAVPLELDQIYYSLDQLTVALGPDGANENGALSDLLAVDRRELRRPGRRQFRQTDQGLRQAQPDPVQQQGGAVRLAPRRSRASSRRWPTTTRPSASSTSRWPTSPTMLEGERERAGRVAEEPRRSRMDQVSGFVEDNREILGRNITGLNRVAKVLVKQRDALDEMLHDRPARAQQPGPDLQPAGRHPRHPRQPRRGRRTRSRPTRPRCCAASSTRSTTRSQVCDAIKRLLGLTRAGRASAERPGRGCRRSDRFDPTLGGLVEVER